jgi:hypothetical protein
MIFGNDAKLLLMDTAWRAWIVGQFYLLLSEQIKRMQQFHMDFRLKPKSTMAKRYKLMNSCRPSFFLKQWKMLESSSMNFVEHIEMYFLAGSYLRKSRGGLGFVCLESHHNGESLFH